jgi:hypothetical protein
VRDRRDKCRRGLKVTFVGALIASDALIQSALDILQIRTIVRESLLVVR